MANRKSSAMEVAIYARDPAESKASAMTIEGCVPFLPPELDRYFDEPEGERAPVEVIDAHVHLFPDRVLDAIYRWFEKHAWRCRYRLHAEEVVQFLRDRGVR